MTTSDNLIGVGVPSLHARFLGRNPGAVTAVGSSLASAAAIQRDTQVAIVTGTGGVALPPIGGDTGCLLTDEYAVVNRTASDISVYAPGGVQIVASGASATGTTGCIVSAATVTKFIACTVSLWAGLKGA